MKRTRLKFVKTTPVLQKGWANGFSGDVLKETSKN